MIASPFLGGYPRTLVAAINLGLEVLRRSNPVDTAELATATLLRACYVSGRRVPIHLMAAASSPDFDTISDADGPVVIELPQVHEAVRALFRISFARRDQRLARREDDVPTVELTIALNAVLQEVLRTQVEALPSRHDQQKEDRSISRSFC